jgi:hypothetical protein
VKRSLPLVLGALSLGVVVVAIALFLLIRRRPAAAPLPNPNGYHDFAAAAQSLSPGRDDLTKLPPEQLREIVEQNASALALVRQGLTKESAVPVEYNQNWATAHFAQLAPNKEMGRLLVGEGLLHLHEGRTNDAARSFTECIQFAHAAHRRGLMIHGLLSIGCQSMAIRRLASTAPNLSPDTRKKIIGQLVQLDREREPASAILDRDREWSRAAYGTLRVIWAQLYMRDIVGKADKRFAAQHARSLASTRLLITDLALRGHEAQHGKPPATLDELVPAWLPSVPLDPFTGKPFIYHVTSDGHLLYSVGPDGKDNQGTSEKRGTTNNFDLLPGEL